MRHKRTLSNNAVIAIDDAGNEIVALGRGIGHGRRPGDELDAARVEQIFVAGGDAARNQLASFLADVPLDVVRVAARIAHLAHERLGLAVTQGLILPLADHLAFAVRRKAEGLRLELPLAWEVAQLYPAELAVGRDAVALASRELHCELDAEEATAFAMHFVNSQFAAPGMTAAMKMTETIARIFEVVGRATGITIDPNAMSTARFVTHLRYLFVRVAQGTQIADPHPTLADAIANAHPEAMACAEKIAYLIGMDTDTTLGRDEVAYLALHVARLVWAAREVTPPA